MVSLLSSLIAASRGWWARQQALSTLYAMDDRALADIGLTKGDISLVAQGEMPYRPRAPRAAVPAPANTITARAA
jgi:uncharacterized protein YjiS (DUF1127 family)